MAVFSKLSRILAPGMFAGLLVLLVSAPVAWGQPGMPLGGPFADTFGDEKPMVEVSVQADRTWAPPGGELVIAVIIDHNNGFHTNLNEPVVPPGLEGFTPIATEIEIADGPFEIGPIQWPKPHAVSVNFTGQPAEMLVYSDRAVAFVPVRLAGDAPVGDVVSIEVEVSYQACDDVSCLPPETATRRVEIRVVDKAEAGDKAGADQPGFVPPANMLTAGTKPLFDGFKRDVFDSAWARSDGNEPTDASSPSGSSSVPSSELAPASGTFFGIPLPGGGIVGLIILGLLGALGGLILNLTPCVLPVIPIKVMTLSRHAGENRIRAAVLGLWMALGVVAFWAALAIPVLTLRGFTDPSRIFGIWWLTTGIGIIIAAMSLGLMGMFQINLPQKAYMINPKADSPWGSFVFGVMTAVLGLPCFGFVAGALVPAAITQGSAFVVVLFTSMGVGMALPYLVLSIFPQFLDKLPRTGPASELVKQIMGLLLLAAAAYFVGSGLIALVATKPYLGKLLHIWVAALLGVLAGGWLAFKTFQITRRPALRVVFTSVALFIAWFGLMIAGRFTSDARAEYEVRLAAMGRSAFGGELLTTIWLDYSPGLMEHALDRGMVVVLDFTAEWCINCKVLEKTVLGVEPVKSHLQADDTIMLKVDLTGKNPEGEAALASLGRTGIPTLAIFGPGLDEPWVASAYTREQVVDAIERARGVGAGDAVSGFGG